MKIKVKALANELNISDQTLIHWLTRKGYPGARGQDWLTPHLARRARAELRARAATQSLSQNHRFSNAPIISPELKRSLELSLHQRGDDLEGEEGSQQAISAHSSSHSSSHSSVPPQHVDRSSHHASYRDAPHAQNKHALTADHERGLNESHGQDLIQRERARADLLLKRLEEQRLYHEDRYQELRQRYERTIGERTQLRQTLYSMGQNQETLDQTCRELSQELDQTRREVNDLKRDLKAQEKMSTAIDQVTQQKQAWRAKALALEERVHTNQQLSAQLEELGMDSLEMQIRLFQTLLATPESAGQLFHAIKMVEHGEVRQMVSRWVVPTCAHPLCAQVNQLARKLSLRVDRASQCQVCSGDAEKRWFRRMMVSCEVAHVRRFLLVGAEDVHVKIRELTEGQSIDFRLISVRDESPEQRIRSRLENCDLLISWPHELTDDPSTGAKYRAVAEEMGAPSLEIPGTKAQLSKLARLILHWVNRTGGHP